MSSGFPNRQFGDVYHNPNEPTDLMQFQDFKSYPKDIDKAWRGPSSDNWPTESVRNSKWNQIKTVLEKIGSIKEVNKPISSLLGVLVAHMFDPKTKEHWFFVKWVENVKIVVKKFTSIPAGTIHDAHPGLIFGKGSSETYKLKPSNVLGNDSGPYSPIEIWKRINKITTGAPVELISQLSQAVNDASKKKNWPITITGGAQYSAFHTKYTNEWIAPIALSRGYPNSQKKMLEIALFDGQPMDGAEIFYSTSPTEKLTDSYIEKNVSRIDISSKQSNSGGAAASLDGIYEIYMKKKLEFPRGFFNRPQVKDFIQVVSVIMSSPATEGMLNVAVILGIIAENQIRPLLDAKRGMSDSAAGYSPETIQLRMRYGAKINHPDYDPHRHLIAGIAKAVCEELNKKGFSDVFKAILNKGALVQCYISTVTSGDDLNLTGMRIVWPAEFDGDIVFTSGKTFDATRGTTGRLGFKIK